MCFSTEKHAHCIYVIFLFKTTGGSTKEGLLHVQILKICNLFTKNYFKAN